MKKFNFNITAFLYSFFAYAVYLVFFIFIKRSGYPGGIYLFTPAYLFALYKLFTIGLWKSPSIMIYVFLPFVFSAYLSSKGGPSGWEVTGIIPFTVLSTFLFKSGKQAATPLENIYVAKGCFLILCSVAFFSAIHFFHKGDIESAIYLALSIYSPAPLFMILALFVNFIISTAAVSVILNNLNLFNKGGKIERLIFDSDDYLNLPHLNLSGIETAKGVTPEYFLEKVEQLNEVARKSKEYAGQLKQNKLFTKKINGSTLAMAPLSVMLKAGVYKTGDIILPENGDKRSFIALAEDSRLIGYYVIDKITAQSNSDILKAVKSSFKIDSVIAGANDPELWKECCLTVENLDEAASGENDLIISSKKIDTVSHLACWGEGEKSFGDIFIVKPFVATILNLVIISSSLKNKFFKGIIIVSIPFAFSLFSASMGLKIPQVSASSVMFSFVFTVFYVFYIKKRKAK